jgi:hypothetical protein
MSASTTISTRASNETFGFQPNRVAGLGRIAKREGVKRAEQGLVNFTDEAEQREGSADMNKKRDGLALK